MYLDHYCLPNICNTSPKYYYFSAVTRKKVEVFIWICLLFKNKVSLFYLNNYQQTHSKVPDKVGKEVQGWFARLGRTSTIAFQQRHCGRASVLTFGGSVYWVFLSNVRYAFTVLEGWISSVKTLHGWLFR